MAICRRLLIQLAERAPSFALARAGNSIAARIAMIATTTRSSIKVKARSVGVLESWGFETDSAYRRRMAAIIPHSITPFDGRATAVGHSHRTALRCSAREYPTAKLGS